MFNTIAQIALGIVYGFYLATFAPTSQRQKAYKLLTQQAVVPMLQQEPKQRQTKTSLAEPTTKPAVIPDIVEDPWSAEPTPAVKERQETTAAIATVPPVPTLLLLPPAQLDHKQTVKASSRRKTKSPKTKRIKNADRANGTINSALTEKTVEQLRSLCKDRNIKWRYAHGSKHLTKTEMLERLTA